MGLPWHPFLTVWALLAVNIASPGPNVLNTIATALGSGRLAGLGSAAGVALGITLWCVGMTVGVTAVLSVVPGFRLVLTVAAVLLLMAFAQRYLRAALAGWRGVQRGLPAERDGLGFGRAFARSLAVNAVNPKALTTWIAVLSLFPTAEAGPADVALLALGASVASFSIHVAYALAFSTPVAARLYLRHGWMLSAIAGLFFTGFAVKLALGLVQNL